MYLKHVLFRNDHFFGSYQVRQFLENQLCNDDNQMKTIVSSLEFFDNSCMQHERKTQCERARKNGPENCVFFLFVFSLWWGGYISRIYPESTQELNQILGPFWSVYKAESPQDLKKSVNKPELTQKVPRKSFKFWALSLPCLHFFKILGTFCFVNRPERAQNLIEFLGTFWVNSANVASPL